MTMLAPTVEPSDPRALFRVLRPVRLPDGSTAKPGDVVDLSPWDWRRDRDRLVDHSDVDWRVMRPLCEHGYLTPATPSATDLAYPRSFFARPVAPIPFDRFIADPEEGSTNGHQD